MTRPRERYRFEPATMTWQEAAEYAFRRGESWLRHEIGTLASQGFPCPHPAMGLFLKADIDHWLRREFGHDTSLSGDADARILRKARNGNVQGALPRR